MKHLIQIIKNNLFILVYIINIFKIKRTVCLISRHYIKTIWFITPSKRTICMKTKIFFFHFGIKVNNL